MFFHPVSLSQEFFPMSNQKGPGFSVDFPTSDFGRTSEALHSKSSIWSCKPPKKPRPRPSQGGRLSRPFPGGFLLKFSWKKISMRPSIVVGKNWPTKIFSDKLEDANLKNETKKSCQNPFNQQISDKFSTSTTHHLTSGITSSQESLPFPSQTASAFCVFSLASASAAANCSRCALTWPNGRLWFGETKPVGDF